MSTQTFNKKMHQLAFAPKESSEKQKTHVCSCVLRQTTYEALCRIARATDLKVSAVLKQYVEDGEAGLNRLAATLEKGLSKDVLDKPLEDFAKRKRVGPSKKSLNDFVKMQKGKKK